MRSKFGLVTSMLILVVALLAACATSPGAESTSQESKTGLVEKTIYVGPTLEDCVGEGPQKCLLIKEEPEGEYTFFYNQIVGFEFEEGFTYKLVIEEEQVENPPAGASSLKWTLVHIDSKTPVSVFKASNLEETRWVLISYLNQEGALVEMLDYIEITAIFQDGQLTGNAGCNNYFGTYQADGSNLTIGPLASTEMYCMNPPGVMDQESAYLTVLVTAANYQLEDDQLLIINSQSEPILTFIPVEPKSLTGTLWKVIMYNNGMEAVVSVILGTEITAIFDDVGEISGTSGCNNYSASYEVNGENISIGPSKISRMYCAEPDGIMDQEMQYLAALEMASSYQFEGDNLIFMDSEGRRVVDYQPAHTFALSETLWHLRAYNDGAEAIVSTLNGTDITTTFKSEGNLSGFAGCNNFSGTYEIEGEMISIELGPKTMKFCEEPKGVMDQEAAFLETLQSVTHYQIRGDVLVMMDNAGQEVLNFQASDLIGYVWMWLEFLENNDTRTAPDNPWNYSIQFHPDDRVEIQADCNNTMGTYTLNGNQIDIKIVLTTLAVCPSGSLSDEYIRLLNDAVIYFRDGDFLYLDITMDAGTMKFFH